jgi:hypothetical protein
MIEIEAKDLHGTKLVAHTTQVIKRHHMMCQTEGIYKWGVLLEFDSRNEICQVKWSQKHLIGFMKLVTYTSPIDPGSL